MRTCLLLLTTPFILAACEADNDPSTAGQDVVIQTIGDTTVVRTLSGSVWGAEATLVPEVSIGELDGPEEYLFGWIFSIAVDDDRNVYVFDYQAQHVGVFDSAGDHVETLGRPGEGPGEFNRAEAIALLPDGRLVVRNPGNQRIEVFGSGSWSDGAVGIPCGGPAHVYTTVHGHARSHAGDHSRPISGPVLQPHSRHAAPRAGPGRDACGHTCQTVERVDDPVRAFQPHVSMDGPPQRPFPHRYALRVPDRPCPGRRRAQNRTRRGSGPGTRGGARQRTRTVGALHAREGAGGEVPDCGGWGVTFAGSARFAEGRTRWHLPTHRATLFAAPSPSAIMSSVMGCAPSDLRRISTWYRPGADLVPTWSLGGCARILASLSAHAHALQIVIREGEFEPEATGLQLDLRLWCPGPPASTKNAVDPASPGLDLTCSEESVRDVRVVGLGRVRAAPAAGADIRHQAGGRGPRRAPISLEQERAGDRCPPPCAQAVPGTEIGTVSRAEPTPFPGIVGGGGGGSAVCAAAAGQHRGEPERLRRDVLGRVLPAFCQDDVGVSAEGSWVDGAGA